MKMPTLFKESLEWSQWPCASCSSTPGTPSPSSLASLPPYFFCIWRSPSNSQQGTSLLENSSLVFVFFFFFLKSLISLFRGRYFHLRSVLGWHVPSHLPHFKDAFWFAVSDHKIAFHSCLLLGTSQTILPCRIEIDFDHIHPVMFSGSLLASTNILSLPN